MDIGTLHIGTLDLVGTMRRAGCDHAVEVTLLDDGHVGLLHRLPHPGADAAPCETIYHGIAWDVATPILPDIARTYFERSHRALFAAYCERDPACAPRPPADGEESHAHLRWESGEGHAPHCPYINGAYPAHAVAG